MPQGWFKWGLSSPLPHSPSTRPATALPPPKKPNYVSASDSLSKKNFFSSPFLSSVNQNRAERKMKEKERLRGRKRQRQRHTGTVPWEQSEETARLASPQPLHALHPSSAHLASFSLPNVPRPPGRKRGGAKMTTFTPSSGPGASFLFWMVQRTFFPFFFPVSCTSPFSVFPVP